MASQRVVIVSDDGGSCLLGGDPEEGHYPYEEDGDGEDCEHALPALLAEGWAIISVTAGSGSTDDSSFWLVVVGKE